MDREFESTMDYTNFNDMKRYNPNFHEDQVKDMSDREIRDMFKKYYSEHLPVDLLAWMRVYEPEEKMSFKRGYWHQTVFVRDELARMLHKNYEEYKADPVKVISTHMSKSIVLPVYYIYLEAYDTKIIMRNNFYDWKISIESEYTIHGIDDFITKEEKPINPIYCEGFEESWVYGMYKDNYKKFTVEIGSNDYNLYTFLYMVKNSLQRRGN